MNAAARLDGLGVVITRPQPAAEALAAALREEGARAFVFPSLAIGAAPLSQRSLDALARLGECTLAIFISANAVAYGLAAAGRAGRWPPSARVAAVGEATAAALRNSGFEAVISPRERQDSEALLAVPELRVVKGENVIVFRGEGGREHLREVLESRGARVDYVECYRRARPNADPAPLLRAWERGEVHAVNALSAETLENFVAMLGRDGEGLIADSTLVVPHPAIAAHPDARRFAAVVVAAPGADGLVSALARVRVAP
ncbi:MAG TPA: uroporphyrinogen-III synthase [Usitatibacter sp.]|nr:uroporphyrinogen-III synthase [Usitatibacter sp.]